MAAAARPHGFRLPAWGWVSLALLLAITLVAAYVALRKPERIERFRPPVIAELPAEIAKRVADLRARNADLVQAIAKIKDDIAAKLCPPGQQLKADAGGTSKDAANPLPVTAPAKALTSAALPAALEKATALVMTEDATGSGFFISRDLLVTNRHVVEEAQHGLVLIASRALGEVKSGRVIAATPKSETGAADFALIRINGAQAPGHLVLTTSYVKLQPVVAAGYPGLTLMNDQGFRRLIDGDVKAAPDLNMTPGAIQSVQEGPSGAQIVHTASILQGNSGGPLVDACGRVVGVNSFIAVDQEQSGRSGYALATQSLIGFLRGAGVTPVVESGPCN